MNEAIVYGHHAVRTLLEHHPGRTQQLILQQGPRQDPETQSLLTLARTQGVAIETLTPANFTKRFGDVNHQGCAARITPIQALNEYDLDTLIASKADACLLLILDQVTDPHNLGACLRTAEAAGVDAVIVPKDNSAGITPVVRKVASGAADIVPLIAVTNLARTMTRLQSAGIWIYGAAHEASESIHHINFPEKTALVMGAEGHGMRRLTREHCDVLFHLPMSGVVESLNVSVATGVCLYEILRQRNH